MFRIYTENKNPEMVEAIANDYLVGSTTYSAVGCWRKTCEPSLVVETIGESRANVERAAQAIKLVNNQQSVLVTEIPDNSKEL